MNSYRKNTIALFLQLSHVHVMHNTITIVERFSMKFSMPIEYMYLIYNAKYGISRTEKPNKHTHTTTPAQN